MNKTIDPSKANKSHLHNTIAHKPLRQTLRKNSTSPEQKLWRKIRNKQLGVKFRRQHGIGRYIADFYCAELNLVIEIDGDSHFEQNAEEYDSERNNFMNGLGIRVLRFTNRDIFENLEGVLLEIKSLTPCVENKSLTPP